MIGFKVCNGNPKQFYTFSFCLDRETAKAMKFREHEKNMEQIESGVIHNKKYKVWIEELELDFCKSCGKLTEKEFLNSECMSCEDLRYEAMLDQASLDDDEKAEVEVKNGL